jgi:hypothetical protein
LRILEEELILASPVSVRRQTFATGC